eukprot:SAG11_NODE_8102_length_1060_cov_1.093652_2_plen_80_part_00
MDHLGRVSPQSSPRAFAWAVGGALTAAPRATARSGTHLTAFAHGAGLPAKVFTGFMHHCDWVATIVQVWFRIEESHTAA